jgi:hypothetical protein
MRAIVRLAVCGVAMAGTAMAQDIRGSASGVISDGQKHGIADVEVTVSSKELGVKLTVKSDENGQYQVPFLNPGSYDVTAEKSGFALVHQTGLVVSMAGETRLNITLPVAAVAQEVTVVAKPQLVEADSADRGMTVDNVRVENTPLSGQNIFAQAWSAPGVAVTSGAQRLRSFDVGGSSGMSINGGQPSSNEVLVDGTSALSQSSSVAYVPPVSATQEFRVQSSVYDAQYGWTSGGIVNIATKSGTNRFHGNAYELLQNTIFNANTYNANYAKTARGSAHVNTFGGSIGGPILHNKLFGFFAYEELRQYIPDPFTTSVPTAAQKTGDFSGTYYAANQVRTIYNPYSTRLVNGKYVRDPFPGNKIPDSMINPVAKNVLAGIPLGNTGGDSITGLNNMINGPQSRKFADLFGTWLLRSDYVISDKTTMFVRYSRNKLDESRGFVFSTIGAVNPFDPSKNSRYNRENHNATMQMTHIINPSTTIDVRVGFERFLLRNGAYQGIGYGLDKLGFASQFVSQAVNNIPTFNLASYSQIGAQPQGISPVSQGNAFNALLYKSIGRHTIRTGGEFYLNRVYIVSQGFSSGNFTFNTVFTGSDATAANSTTGNSVASFLLGAPASGYIDVNAPEARQQKLFSLFVQDDFRVSKRFTMNMGLRWDVMTPMTDRHNAVARGFDPNVTSPLQVPGLTLKGGLLYAGVNGNPRGIYNTDYNNFGPRLGFAYLLSSKTVVRGGYGLVFSQGFDDPGNAPGFSQQTAMVSSVTTGVPYNTLTNPFPGGVLGLTGSSLGLSANLGQSLSFANPNRTLPWTQQYSLEMQRELPWKVVASAAYVGSQSQALPVSRSINEISAANLALGTTYLSASVANPFAGLIAGSSLNASTVQRRQLLRPFPQFLGISQATNSIGKSGYNALQALVQKRMSSGSSASLAYTYSKTLAQTSFANAQDSNLEKVVAPWDVTHSIQINGVYELPFGPGHSWGANAPYAVRTLIGGWRISAIARIQSGLPMTTASGVVPTGLSAKLANPTLQRWFNTCTRLASGATQNCLAGESPVWSARPSDTLQTWSSRLSYLRNPAIRNLDASIMKDTKIKESLSFILRLDLLNTTNTPQWFNGPVVDSTSGNFGKVAVATDQSNLPRFLQVSGKLVF